MIASLYERFFGLILYWWFAIFRPQDWIWWDVTSLRLPLIAAALFVIPCFMQGIFPRVKSTIAFLIVSWLALAFFSYLSNGCGIRGDNQMEHLAKLVLVILLCERIVNTDKKIFWLVSVVGLSLCYHSASVGFFSLSSGGSSLYGSNHMEGSFSGSNAFALGTAALVYFVIFMGQSINYKTIDILPPSLQSGFKIKCLQLITILITIGSIYLVIAIESRGSAIALFATITLFIFLQTNTKKILSILIPIALVSIVLIPLPEGYEDRIKSAFEEQEELDHSAASRPHLWHTATLITQQYPLGIGPGCFSSYYNEFDPSNGYFGKNVSVHSSHFQVLAETGYLGLGIWLSLFFISILKLWKVRKLTKQHGLSCNRDRLYFNLCNALICALLTFFGGGSFYELAHIEIPWLIFALVIMIENIYCKSMNKSVIGRQKEII